MKIHFFELDPETGIYKAGCTDENGKRFSAAVWATGGRSYVSTGSRRTGDHRVFWLSEEQSRELARFMNSGEYSREFSEGIA